MGDDLSKIIPYRTISTHFSISFSPTKHFLLSRAHYQLQPNVDGGHTSTSATPTLF